LGSNLFLTVVSLSTWWTVVSDVRTPGAWGRLWHNDEVFRELHHPWG